MSKAPDDFFTKFSKNKFWTTKVSWCLNVVKSDPKIIGSLLFPRFSQNLWFTRYQMMTVMDGIDVIKKTSKKVLKYFFLWKGQTEVVITFLFSQFILLQFFFSRMTTPSSGSHKAILWISIPLLFPVVSFYKFVKYFLISFLTLSRDFFSKNFLICLPKILKKIYKHLANSTNYFAY